MKRRAARGQTLMLWAASLACSVCCTVEEVMPIESGERAYPSGLLVLACTCPSIKLESGSFLFLLTLVSLSLPPVGRI